MPTLRDGRKTLDDEDKWWWAWCLVLTGKNLPWFSPNNFLSLPWIVAMLTLKRIRGALTPSKPSLFQVASPHKRVLLCEVWQMDKLALLLLAGTLCAGSSCQVFCAQPDRGAHGWCPGCPKNMSMTSLPVGNWALGGVRRVLQESWLGSWAKQGLFCQSCQRHAQKCLKHSQWPTSYVAALLLSYSGMTSLPLSPLRQAIWLPLAWSLRTSAMPKPETSFNVTAGPFTQNLP